LGLGRLQQDVVVGVEKLSIKNFRCFAQLELEFDLGSTCIIGRNALGKTSLLEAVAVLTRLQSPRSVLKDVVRVGAKGLVVDGYAKGYHLQFYYSPTRRKLALDGVVQKETRSFLDISKTVYLGNSDIELVRGSSETRRRFLDFIGTQLFTNYREIARSYEKTLRSRNAYLKMTPRRNKEIAAYTKLLIKFGHQLIVLREALVERLEPEMVVAFNRISDRNEPVCIRYQPGAKDLERALIESAEEEQRLHTTVVGPHRDDIQLLVHGKPAEIFASEGQQRTLVIALKLAQTKLLTDQFNQPPVLLIDDIFGELDRERRNRLLAGLPPEGQRIVTTTTLDWLDGVALNLVYRIEEDAESERLLVRI
jgi:DNA replication and repair protein RecF